MHSLRALGLLTVHCLLRDGVPLSARYGLGLANTFLLNPSLQWFTSIPGPTLPSKIMMKLVIALLGLGVLRTAEKLAGGRSD